jgi:hypothetical protein
VGSSPSMYRKIGGNWKKIFHFGLWSSLPHPLLARAPRRRRTFWPFIQPIVFPLPFPIPIGSDPRVLLPPPLPPGVAAMALGPVPKGGDPSVAAR